MTQEQGDALKALIDLAVKSHATTAIAISRDAKDKVLRAAVVCEGNQAKLLVKLMRDAQLTED